jgi:hypothetical protein
MELITNRLFGNHLEGNDRSPLKMIRKTLKVQSVMGTAKPVASRTCPALYIYTSVLCRVVAVFERVIEQMARQMCGYRQFF